MKTRLTAVASVILALVLAVTTGVTQAQATISTIAGTVNCGGWAYPTLYNTTRYLTRLGPITFALTNPVGSTYGGKQLRISVYLVNGGYYEPSKDLDLLADPSYPSSGTLLVSGYVVNTAFRMNASMPAANGACDNSWAGQLNF